MDSHKSMFFLLISLTTASVTSFLLPSHAGYSSTHSSRIWLNGERKKCAARLAVHAKRTPTSVIGAAESSLEPDDDGNISYLKSRFGLKDDWFTNNSKYAEVDNMDQSAMMERITWIKKRLKLNEAQLGKLIQRNPKMLTLRPEMNVEPTLQFLQQELALNNTRLSTLIVSQPTMLGRGIHKNQTLQRNLNWFKSRLHVNDPKKLGKFVVKEPWIITLNVENNLEPTFLSLQNRLGLNDTQAATLCVRCPRLLVQNYSQSFAPKLDWLKNSLNLTEKQLGSIVQQRPLLFSSSLDERLRPNIEWVRDRFSLNTREIAKLVTGQPGILTYTVESMEERLQWFQDHLFVAEDETDIGTFVCREPTLLGLNVKSNLAPTIQFFREYMGTTAASRFSVGSPTVWGTSLKNKLIPRMEQTKDLGIHIVSSLDMMRLCVYTETQWLAWLQKQLRSQ